MKLGTLLASLPLVILAAPAAAQSTVTETIPIPTEVMTGNILFVSLAGPPAGYVVRVGIHAEFHPSGSFTADAVELRLNAPTEPNFEEWVITGGTTLGWSATGNSQVGDAETLTLNGELQAFFPWSIWDLSIGPVSGSGFDGVSGQFLNSYFEVEYVTPGDGPAVGYCFGVGCPCGNDDPNAGCAGSSGLGALLAATGTGSLASEDLAFTLSDMPPGQSGLVFTGASPIAVPFGDGLRCVGSGGAGIHRFPVSMADGSGTISVPNVFASAESHFPGVLDPGETWYFQGWYRDPGGPCGSAFNLSNALELVVIP